VRGCAKAQNSGRVAVEHAAVGARLQMDTQAKGNIAFLEKLLARSAAGLLSSLETQQLLNLIV
jgi:hypothetical protein